MYPLVIHCNGTPNPVLYDCHWLRTLAGQSKCLALRAPTQTVTAVRFIRYQHLSVFDRALLVLFRRGVRPNVFESHSPTELAFDPPHSKPLLHRAISKEPLWRNGELVLRWWRLRGKAPPSDIRWTSTSKGHDAFAGWASWTSACCGGRTCETKRCAWHSEISVSLSAREGRLMHTWYYILVDSDRVIALYFCGCSPKKPPKNYDNNNTSDYTGPDIAVRCFKAYLMPEYIQWSQLTAND